MLTTALALSTIIAAPTIAPEAQPTLEKVMTFYKGLPGASMTLTLKELMPGMGDQVSTMAAFKPNMYKLTQDMGMPGMGSIELISNGTNTWSTETKSKIYSESTASTGFADSPELNLLLAGTPGEFFFSLLSPDPEETFLSGIDRVSSNGAVEVDGTTYDSFTLHTEPTEDLPSAMEIQITVEQGEKPWVHRARMPLPKDLTGGLDVTLEFQASKWNAVDAALPEFTYTPTADQTKVDDLFAALMDSAAETAAPSEEQAMSMVGKPAPTFELKDTEGVTVSLESLKGKTVILDFFATWCGPCRKGMPVLMDIAERRAEEGVVLYAIDLDEPADKIKSFLEKQGWTLNVLMTGDSKVADEYMVGGIPHTVIVAPNGSLQFVEIGFRGKEHAEQQINQAIDKAIESSKSPT
jgi:thiol-disulfide isomerase/thioredoxin